MMGQMDLSNEILTESQVFVVGVGVVGVVVPGLAVLFVGKGVFLSFWQAKIVPSKIITRILFIFFGSIFLALILFERLPIQIQDLTLILSTLIF